MIEETICFTYRVEMIVQVLAPNEQTASRQLEDKGGHITSRSIILLDSVPLFNGIKES